MKNLLIDNQGVQFPQNKIQKTQLEVQIENLKSQEQQVSKRLKLWEVKAKKANNLANCLATADKFAAKFLAEAIENEKAQEEPDNYWLESLIRNQIEFALKFEAGTEAFVKLIQKKVERESMILQNELENIQNQLHHQERKFIRLQARRQGKVLLECKANNRIGCLGVYQCDNCQINYSAIETNQLKGGAC
ncbi:MAG: hypothetical protein MRECE_2c060 [Mycoplasmataceae bacterium CE_OT135]|nr:MAG: hypothetical protein MRECE_2c060 [Mycoplasmataceae bacterium CE_OT135]